MDLILLLLFIIPYYRFLAFVEFYRQEVFSVVLSVIKLKVDFYSNNYCFALEM